MLFSSTFCWLDFCLKSSTFFIQSSGVPGTWRGSDGCYGSSVTSLWLCCVSVEPHGFPALPEYQHIWSSGLETLHHGQEGMTKKGGLWNMNNAHVYIHLVRNRFGELTFPVFSSIQIYLVVSNSGGGPDKHFNKESETDFSVIFKWSKRRKRFVRFQTLQTHCARDWEAFNINQQTYLAVANHRQGKD